MKPLLPALLTAALALPAWAGNAPQPPDLSLEAALRLKEARAITYRPVRFGPGEKLRLTYLRRGVLVTKPGEIRSLALYLYASQAEANGTHALLAKLPVTLPTAGSPVLVFPEVEPVAEFPTYVEADQRVGLIAILIGLTQASRGAPYATAVFPANDAAAADLVAADGSVRLLLPAVQKVRDAAAR
jgi:hypothetical protein